MSQTISTKELKLAEIRLFDAYRMASEIPYVHGYTFLLEEDGQYRTLFRDFDQLPVFGRVPYSNETLNGEDFGSKIVLLQGEADNGPCYIVSYDGKKLFGKEEITLQELKTYILHSEYFFIDRLSIMEEENSSVFDKIRYFQKRKKDMELMDSFEEYFGCFSKELVKK